jgi:hypothetical protein
MTLHLYLDAALTHPLSEGGGAAPDSDNYNGTDGESKDRQIWLANAWTTLSGALTASQTTLSLASGCFTNGETLLIGSEQMQVQSGGGTLTPVVLRGYGGTVPAAHAGGSMVYSGYDYLDLALDVVDESGSNESGWYRLALTQSGLDTAIPGAPLNLGDKSHDQTLTFWRRCTVPPGTPVQNKLDLKLRLTGTEAPIL